MAKLGRISCTRLPVAALICCLACLSLVSGAKIMLAMTMAINSVSQHIMFSAITEPLVQRGHEVVLVAPKNKYIKGLSEEAVTEKIFFESKRTVEEMKDFHDVMKSVMLSLSEKPLAEGFRAAAKVNKLFREGCLHLWEDEITLQRLKRENFDLLITMPIDCCDVLLAEYLGIPFVVMTPVRRAPTISEETFGIPVSSAYVPFNALLPFSDRMNFWQRTANLLTRHVVDPLLAHMTTSHIRSIQLEFDIRPDLTVAQLVGKAHLWLCQTHFAIDFAQPISPNYVGIGGITVKPARPLPEVLEDFVTGSGEDGVVVFTLGSMIENVKNDELTETFARVFSELPQRVIWRYVGTQPRNLGNNTLIMDWLPQNDLVGHPKTRLLIYHGGANGVYEAVKHGVPLLLMPLAFDQMSNAARIEAKGLGIVINKNTLTEESLTAAIHEILHNPKYEVNMKRASGIMKDELVPTRERVAHLIEHVIKFGGDHLRLRAMELNFVQRNLIDVVVFLVFIVCLSLAMAKWCLLKCFRCACRSETTHPAKPKID